MSAQPATAPAGKRAAERRFVLPRVRAVAALPTCHAAPAALPPPGSRRTARA